MNFPVRDDKGLFVKYTGSLDKVYVIIWTTTPWTLPANLAIALNAELEYVLMEMGGFYFVVAKDKAAELRELGGCEEYKVLAEFTGRQLEGIKCKHPFIDRDSVIIMGDHVTLEQGTGCVHTAPGHGGDFVIGMRKTCGTEPRGRQGLLYRQAGKYRECTTRKANDAQLLMT